MMMIIIIINKQILPRCLCPPPKKDVTTSQSPAFSDNPPQGRVSSLTDDYGFNEAPPTASASPGFFQNWWKRFQIVKKSFLILRAVQLAIFKVSQLSRLSPFLGHLFNQLSILEENQVKQELQQIFHQNTIKCIRTSNSWTIGHLSLMSSYAPAGPYYRGRLLVCLFGRLVDFNLNRSPLERRRQLARHVGV